MKLNQLSGVFLLCLLVLSCTSNTIYKKPKDLIGKDQMVNLISDLLIAQGVYKLKSKRIRGQLDYQTWVLQKYEVDSTQLASSMEYYISTIKDYNQILKKVEQQLQSQLKSLNADQRK